MKRNILSRILSAVAALTLAASLTTTFTQAQSSNSVRIENDSDYSIYEIYMSPANDLSWGSDLLGSRRVLPTGYYFTFSGALPGRYDLKLVDEDGDVCVVSDIRVNGNANWSISNSWLLNCEFH